MKGEGEAAQILEVKRGEAEGIQLIADAKAYELEKLNQNPEAYLELKRLEIEQQQIEKWNGDVPQTILGDDSNMFFGMKNLLR